MLERERWVVIADDNKILCRVMNCYIFRPLDKLEGASVVTFESQNEASATLRVYVIDYDTGNYNVVKAIEKVELI